MVGLIDEIGKVIFTGTEGEIDNLDIENTTYERTDDGVDRAFRVFDIFGVLVDEVETVKEARNLLRLDVNNTFIVAHEV